MTSFLDEAASFITPELLGKAASAFGVSADGAQKAIGAAVPTVLGSIAGKAGDAGFMSDLFHMITQPAAAGGGAGAASSVLDAIASGGNSPMLDMSKKLLGGLLGNAGPAVTSAIGQMAGAGSSGGGILGTVGALAISMLGRRVSSGGLSVASLAGSLLSEKASLMKAIPGPIAALMAPAAPARRQDPAATLPPHLAYKPGHLDATMWFTRTVGVMGFLLLGWYALKDRNKAPAPVVVEPMPAPAVEVMPPGLQGLTLPNGVQLQVSPTGIESQMVAFILDTTKVIDKTTWFDFDRLLFETGSAVLQPSSMEQLKNISEIMKAFPNVKIKLGGYTDNVGQAAANMKLSSDRASTALAELIKLGVAGDRLEAEGYGDTVPVADNNTEEGRAKNRRTAARVTAK